MPGTLGKCALSPRCFPKTKAYLRNLKEEDEHDYGCQGELLLKGEYSMGAYDYDWWPDTEVQGSTSTTVHWQQLPQPYHTHNHTDKLHAQKVISRKLTDIRKAYGAAFGEVEQSIEIQELIDFAESIDAGGVAASHLKRFSLETCPFGMIRDCDNICWHKDSCTIPTQGIFNCSMLIGDNICHDGEIKNRPNFNCLRFGCDGGDCDETCLDVMMKKILAQKIK